MNWRSRDSLDSSATERVRAAVRACGRGRARGAGLSVGPSSVGMRCSAFAGGHGVGDGDHVVEGSEPAANGDDRSGDRDQQRERRRR